MDQKTPKIGPTAAGRSPAGLPFIVGMVVGEKRGKRQFHKKKSEIVLFHSKHQKKSGHV